MRLSRRAATLGLGGTLVSGVATAAYLSGGSGRDRPSGSRAPTRGRGARTAFGSVAVLGATWQPPPGDDAVHQHGDRPLPEDAAEPGGHGIWPQAVLVGVQVHNGLDRPLLFSPGQFRLRVGPNGPSVTPYAAEGPSQGLAARTTLTTWVSFLTPDGADDLAVEFTETGAEDVLSIALDSIAATGPTS